VFEELDERADVRETIELRRVAVVYEMPADDRDLAVAVEQRVAGEHLERERAECVDVRGHRRGIALEVVREHAPHLGRAIGAGRTTRPHHATSEPEVDERRCAAVP
jgi:hypothetical protein